MKNELVSNFMLSVYKKNIKLLKQMCFCFPFIFLQCSWLSKTLSMLPEVKTIGFGGKGLLLCIDSHHCGGCFSTWNFGCENRNSWLTKRHPFSIKSSSSAFSTLEASSPIWTRAHTQKRTHTHIPVQIATDTVSYAPGAWKAAYYSWGLVHCL